MAELSPVKPIILLPVIGLLPFFLMMVTSCVKIVVLLSLVRNAPGVQQVTPVMVLNGAHTLVDKLLGRWDKAHGVKDCELTPARFLKRDAAHETGSLPFRQRPASIA